MSGALWARDPFTFRGRVEMRPFESAALRDNALGDPYEREVPVYLPPGWEAAGARFPVLFLLHGFTSRPHSYLETHPWKKGVVLAFDRAVADGACPPAILVMPDGFTRMGGGQYVNSACTGDYEDYVARELVAWADETYPTLPGRRGVVGKSSGGFGAMRLSMLYPETFPVAASISGDCCFELGYGPELLAAVRGLQEHEGGPARFLESFYTDPSLAGDGHAILNLLAMSACYSPDPASPLGFALPVDLETGERIRDVWERWLAFDPVRMVARHADAWRRLELLHLECGRWDEFHLQLGLRVLVRELQRLEVPHEHEEFEGGHFDINERYGALFPKLIGALAG